MTSRVYTRDHGSAATFSDQKWNGNGDTLVLLGLASIGDSSCNLFWPLNHKSNYQYCYAAGVPRLVEVTSRCNQTCRRGVSLHLVHMRYNLYASWYLCIIVCVHYICMRDILCASNIVCITFHVHKIFCASKNEPYFVCITFIPKLTTTVYIFYLIPGTRPRISSSSLLFWFHLGKHLKTRI